MKPFLIRALRALYFKGLVPYLTVFISGMWSCSSLLVLYGLTDVTVFLEKIVLTNCFGVCNC